MEEYEVFEIIITDRGKEYSGKVTAYIEPGLEGTIPNVFHITLDGKPAGVVSFTEAGWSSNSKKISPAILDKIAVFINDHYH